ncbi:MAG: tetratricopeptide repeat protein [Usitatibacter sp.]
MKLRLFHLPFLFALAVPGLAQAHDADSQSGTLGKVSFPTSCDPKVQPAFERGVAMLHSFWYSAAEKTFRDVLKDDPQCAIATWGVASILMSNALAGQGASPKGAESAQEAIDEGRRIGAKTERERDYIEAVAAYYKDFAARSEKERQISRAKAYEALAQRYPADDEAQIFYALYLAGTQTQADQTYAAYSKAAAILEEEFKKFPDHPGVAHYLIHSYDAPPLAEKGLVAARRYAIIAPAAPHALHMPSHIFTRVGSWQESVATNARSMEVAKVAGDIDEAYHAADYMVYADLQLGRDADARRTVDEALKVSGSSPRFVAPYAMAAMPARYVFERGAWLEAAKLQPIGSPYPFVEAITYFTRSVGEARSGDLAAARKDAERLETAYNALVAAKNTYWATEVEIQRLAAAGWIALGEGKSEEALKFMRGAADLEDRNEKHIVTPGRIVPARELLGDILIEMKQPAAALKEYEASQRREPNRFRNYSGAARAAEMAGDRAKATAYYGKLMDLARDGDGTRPELAAAKKYAQR